MKRLLKLSGLHLPILGLVLFFAARAGAETPREELVHAYVLLSVANHDYGGHRVLAMKEIESAGRTLGLDLKGDRVRHESQLRSEEQLAEARRLLQHAREKLEARDRERAADRVDLAIKEIDLALLENTGAPAETPRGELVHAYVLLKLANHDYGGHRLRAMEELESAGKTLGLELKGEGSEHERQRKSDEHLVEARRLLQHAREKLEARDRERAAERVDLAIKQIDLALLVR